MEWEKTADPLRIKKDVSWIDIIRADMDVALTASSSWEEFLQNLRDRHYEIKDGKNLSVRPEGKERFVRTGRLGNEYTKESLILRVGEESRPFTPYGDPEPMLQALREHFSRIQISELTPLKKAYYERWYAFSYVNHSRSPWKYREALTDLGRYTDRCAYLFRHDITDVSDLMEYSNNLHDRQKVILKKLTRINNQIYNTPISDWRKLEKLRSEMISATEVERKQIQNCIDTIVANLKNIDLIAESAKYRSLQTQKELLQSEKKKLKAETKMVEDLINDWNRSLMPDDIMRDPDRYIPSPFTEKSYQRITVNRVLIQDLVEDSAYIKVKVPGTQEYILLYKDDTRIAQDGSFASSYLYDHLAYQIVDNGNAFIHSVSGQEAMTYFEDRTKERRQQHGRK